MMKEQNAVNLSLVLVSVGHLYRHLIRTLDLFIATYVYPKTSFIFDSLRIRATKMPIFRLAISKYGFEVGLHMTTRNDRLKCSYLLTVLAVRERHKYKRVKMVTCRPFMFNCHYSYDVSTWCGIPGITWT